MDNENLQKSIQVIVAERDETVVVVTKQLSSLEEQIKSIVAQRDDLVVQTNRRLSFLEGKIEALEELLKMYPDDEPEEMIVSNGLVEVFHKEN